MTGFKARRALSGPLLKQVSRSFYLTIRVLPHRLREPVTVAYLLARTSDTIADTADVPAASRLAWLTRFGEWLGAVPAPDDAAMLRQEIRPEHEGERELLAQAPALFAWLNVLPAADRAEVVDVMADIIEGQRADLEGFAAPGGLAALKTAADLDRYTYLVAGCVGRFWTRLCLRHIPRFSETDPATLTALGVNFGKGLQLVNILRDLPADIRAGRCYLPEEELGAPAAEAMGRPELIRPVFARWLATAGAHLDDAYRYIESLHNRRIRYACILPWRLGVRTLELLSNQPPLETAERVKVSRCEVRRVLVSGLFAAVSNSRLRALR